MPFYERQQQTRKTKYHVAGHR